MTTIRYFSTFSGIGGFELGIERAAEATGIDVECVGYSEIDKPAIRTYREHYDHDNYGDATGIDADSLPGFDLLVGGFPCQAFSIAGKRHGFEDTRGTLFFDIARILKARAPQFFILENVRGLISHDQGRTFRTIITALDELGYDVQWQVLNSKDYGVPQSRERVYLVGNLGGTPRPQIFPAPRSHREDPGYRVSSIRELTGASSQGHRLYDPEGISPTISTGGASTGGAEVPRIKLGDTIRRLTPTEFERLQGFPDGWTVGSDTQRYKQLGNAVTVNVVQAVATRLFGAIAA